MHNEQMLVGWINLKDTLLYFVVYGCVSIFVAVVVLKIMRELTHKIDGRD